MVGVYVTSLAVVLASLLLGAGAMRICGYRETTWASGALGNAILITLVSVAIRLPGAVVTALLVTGVALLIAAVAVRRQRPRARAALEGGLVAAIVLALLGLPFLPLGHFGLLGVSLDNDLGFHIGWVEQFHAGHAPFGIGPHAYPTGLEALAGVFGGSLRGANQALVGTAAAGLVLSALTAITVLRRAPSAVRVLGAAAVGLPYLSAAYFGEGSFKEPEMGMLVLGLALFSARLPESARWWALRGVPMLALTAATYLTLGPGGLVYPAVIVVARLVVAAARRFLPGATARVKGLAIAGAALACVLVAGVVYAAHRHSGVIPFALSRAGHAHPGGNLARALPFTEGFGVWFGRSFRLAADSTPLAPLAIVLALGALAVGAVLAARARDGTLVVPAVGVLAVVLIARATVIPYDAAKAMVAAGPLLVLTAIAPLATVGAPRDGPFWSAMIGPAVAGVLAFAVLWTSACALRSSPVDSDHYDSQLAALQPVIDSHAVIFLGHDDWIAADLPGTVVAEPVPHHEFPLPLSPRPQKGLVPPFDFDTEPVAGLDTVPFVITTRSLDASSAPPNFRPVRVTRDFILWVRDGSIAPRQVLDERSQPGAVLDCRTPAGSRLAARSGVAAVRPVPIIGPAWRRSSGSSVLTVRGYVVTPAGGQAYTTLRLPPGRWQLSLDYRSPAALHLRVGTSTFSIPSRLEPVGQLWAVAEVSARGGPVPVELMVAGGPAPLPLSSALAGPLHAVPADLRDRVVPLHAACGRYVDWYRLGG